MKKYVAGLQHIGLPTLNIQKTIEFYEDLGFQVAWNTPDGKVAFLRLNDLTIETYQTDTTAGIAGAIDHIALNVSDIEETFQWIKTCGYTLLDQEIDSRPFWENGVRFFNILGPNGEKIEFGQII